VPSRVFLDEPYPANLPIVPACETCNGNFSKDEQYLACIVECALTGSPEPDVVRRDKIKRILSENPALAARLATSQQRDGSGAIVWKVEMDRVRKVVLKLARGHVAYQFSVPQLDEPETVALVPFVAISEDQRNAFESPPRSSVWPEIGSRAFIRDVQIWPMSHAGEWIVVQPERYRYSVTQADGIVVRMVLSEYLACEVLWP
jgi:hypothetical protein